MTQHRTQPGPYTCLPTALAMLAECEPEHVVEMASGVLRPTGMTIRDARPLAAALGIVLGECATGLPATPEPGTYLLAIDARTFYCYGPGPREAHAVVAHVREDGRVTVYDGRQPGAIVKSYAHVAAHTLACAPASVA